MSIKLLIVVEGDLEAFREFANNAESNAFEDGFDLASGLLGSPSTSTCTKVDDGPWTIEDQEDTSQTKRLADAIEQAKKRGYDV